MTNGAVAELGRGRGQVSPLTHRGGSKGRLDPFPFRHLFLIGLLGVFPACKSTYSRDKIKEEIALLAQKEYGLKMDVYEVGDTVIARYFLNNLPGELVAEDQKLGKDADHILLVLARVTLSMENPPQFFVLEIVDEENPNIRFTFTRYVQDIKKYLAEAISTTHYLDSLLMEFVIGKERKIFEPSELDFVSFLMLALSAGGEDSGTPPDLTPQEVFLPDFIASVAAARARRLLREKSDLKKFFFLKGLLGQFEGERKEFRFIVELVPKSSGRAPLTILEKNIFPFIANQAVEIVKSYKYQQFSKILVTDKHSGKMMVFPK